MDDGRTPSHELIVYRRRTDGEYDLLVAHATQTRKMSNSWRVAYGISSIAVGAAAGLLKLNPFAGSAAATTTASAASTAQGIRYYANEMPDLLRPFCLMNSSKGSYSGLIPIAK